MKKTVLSIFLVVMIAGAADAYDRGHTYIRGIISDMGDAEVMLSGVDEPLRTERLKTITLDGSTYTIDPKCRVAIQYFEKGAYHERAGRFYDLRRGISVYARKIGNVVNEILIEEWKR